MKKVKVLKNEVISEDIYKLKLEGNFTGKPGQFFMLRAWDQEPILNRPISIYDIDDEGISFLYHVCGKGTEIFKKLEINDEVKVMGPLGNGFPLENISGKVAVITGGIGIAPMNYVVKNLESCDIDLYSGFREEAYAVEELKSYVKNLNISTENGAQGHKGYITEIFNPDKYEIVLCCGPEIMMNKVIEMCKGKKVPLYVSLEKKMACGIGACLVCTCKTKDGNKKSCKDGPVFLAEELEE
ncbi:dihydroorotate dehydrogenase electron transfer subunit [Clostridium pascui]|uniref:dihydroorotate dehydrogenase electron transfer subunit n=1 Tax=Clostridium pascui TaxID=46609 RepID=UPI00195BA570|nr:dihydroorotate dehydrogenase electron transfer subunit [Clostridium pascui]MBM7871869.1 dihydroorotate dehydrogenase electron transfer subunit [Clostridium pascui]